MTQPSGWSDDEFYDADLVIPFPPESSVDVVIITQTEYDALQARVQELEAQLAEALAWEPVVDGHYYLYKTIDGALRLSRKANYPSLPFANDETKLYVSGDLNLQCLGSDYLNVKLPEGWRLQRRQKKARDDDDVEAN
jgi:hypothetical protein